MDLFQTLKDVNKFVRELTIKKHFLCSVTTEVSSIVCHANPSDVNHIGNNLFLLQTSFREQVATQALLALHNETLTSLSLTLLQPLIVNAFPIHITIQ